MTNMPISTDTRVGKIEKMRIFRSATNKWETVDNWWYIKNIHWPKFKNRFKNLMKLDDK